MDINDSTVDITNSKTDLIEEENIVQEVSPTRTLKKRVSIQSDFKFHNPGNFQLKQQNYSSPQLINNINGDVQEVLKNKNTSVKVDSNSNNELKVIPDKLISEISSIALELMSNKTPEVKDSKDLLIYTKAMELPSKLETLIESRVILRFCQLFSAIGAFASLSVSSLDVNYKSSALAESGINTMCLVSISSMIVACATLFVYFNPKFLGISPQRHFRSSRVEVCVDLLFLAFWIFASSEIAIYGDCPQKFFDINASSERSCYSWNFCMSFGFLASILYIFTFIRGIYDLKTHDWGRRTSQKYTGKGVYLWVRGNWKDMNQED